MICRHCQIKKANRPRGLCWGCYYSPGVKDLYPLSNKYRRGILDFNGQAKNTEPTKHMPGTKEKIEILIKRAQGKQELFHPLDAE